MKAEHEWIKELARKKIYDNKDIIELLRYDNTSLWFLVEPWLNNTSKHYYSINEIFDIAYNKSNIRKKRLFFRWVPKAMFFLKILARKIRIPKNKIKKSKVLVATHPSFYQNNINVRVGILIEKLQESYSASTVLYEDLASLGSKTIGIVRKYRNSHAVEVFFDVNLAFEIIKKSLKYLRVWNHILKSEKFRNELVINNRDCSKMILPLLEDIISKMIIESIFYFEITKKIIDRFKPKLIVSGGGLTTQERAIIHAANEKNIKAYSVQEGLVCDSLYHCCTEDDIKRGYKTPDKMFVYGQATKDILTKEKGYKSRNIIIVGSPNSDYIERLRKKIDKISELKRLKLDPELKTITFFTVPCAIPLMEKMFMDVVYPIKRIGNLNLIVKLHPRDMLYNRYKEILNKSGIQNVQIIKDVNVYNTLLISDVSIVYSFCTVCLEALMSKKKTLILNIDIGYGIHKKFLKMSKFIVNKPKEIEKMIRDIVEDEKKETIRGNDEKINKFITNEVYKVDGKVNERIMDKINKDY